MSSTKVFTSQEDTSKQQDPGKGLDTNRLWLKRFNSYVGPVSHLQTERDRLLGLKWEHFSAEMLGSTIGAEISGLDLSQELPQEVIDELRQALLDYKVIFFRDQKINTDHHTQFARYFGDLEVHPFLPSNEKHPELVRFEKNQNLGGYENGWHSDVTWRECPSMGAILHAVEVPKIGGDTLFADMYAVYEGLSDRLKEEVDPLIAVHDYVQAFGAVVPEDKKAEMREAYPVVRHPVIRTHPETGRRLVYVNRFFVSHIEGMEEEESNDLLRRLFREAEAPEYQCRFSWEKDSIAFWDNRATQHYAASDYFPDKRIMERASIIGDRPV